MSKIEREGQVGLSERICALEKLLADAHAQIANTEKEMDSFSYSVSHDLRAPLRAIEGFSRILTEDYSKGLDEEGKRFLEYIQANAQQMSRLIDDLLTFYRLGQVRLSKRNIEMNDLINGVLAELKVTQPAADCEFNLQPLAPAFADVSQLKVAFFQLISNAIKFRAPNRKLTVDIYSETLPQEVVYAVRDNGQGFDMQYANKLFKVFQKLQRSDAHPGNGIGLAMVQRIIARQGGRVWAEGKPNEGSTFFVALPAETAEEDRGKKEASPGV